MPETDQNMRLDKYLATCLNLSRKDAKNYCIKGKIKINGQAVKNSAIKIMPNNDVITYLDKPLLF